MQVLALVALAAMAAWERKQYGRGTGFQPVPRGLEAPATLVRHGLEAAATVEPVVAVDVSTKGDEGEYGIQRGLWVALAGAAVIAASATEPATRTLKQLVKNRTGRAS